MGEWDLDEVRRLFNSLEFRTLLDRLQDVGHGAKPKVEVAELDLREATADELAATARRAAAPLAVRLDADGDRCRGWRCPPGGAQAAYAPLRVAGIRWPGSSPTPARRSGCTTPRRSSARAASAGGARWRGVAFDTLLAGYLLDPGQRRLPAATRSASATWASTCWATVEDEDEGQLFSRGRVARRGGRGRRRGAAGARDGGADRPAGPARAARGRRAAAASRAGADGGPRRPPRRRLPGGDGRGRARPDGHAEGRRSTSRRARSSTSTRRRSCAAILYDKLGPAAGQEDAEGRAVHRRQRAGEAARRTTRSSTRSCHWRELDKLNSTYLDALPRLVDPRGRTHPHHVQPGGGRHRAALSSSNPNLQNIPVRRRARPPDPPGVRAGRAPARCCWCADYSQIELRILAHLSGDAGLREAFASGSRHPRRDRGEGVRPAARRRSTRARAAAPRWSTTGSRTG